MSDYKRHAENVTKLALMGVVGVSAIAVLLLILGWPMVLWFALDESLGLSLTVTIVWLVALLGL